MKRKEVEEEKMLSTCKRFQQIWGTLKVDQSGWKGKTT